MFNAQLLACKNSLNRCRGRAFALTSITLLPALIFATPAQASILVDVLRRIAAMGPSPLGAIMINASLNEPVQTLIPTYLQTGQTVVIGYNPSGAPVTAPANALGVLVTPAQAAQLTTGLAAGLYPVGSQLYSVPPAGQLSLYQADQRGNQLEQATTMALATIDGSIQNIISAALFPDLAAVGIVATDVSQRAGRSIDIDKLSTTVLGAVNSGKIISEIRIDTIVPDGATLLGTDPAIIGHGATIGLQQAMADNVSALSLTQAAIGGQTDVSALVLNLSHSASGINAQVANIIDSQSASIKSITTTAIGAVNDGRIFGEQSMGLPPNSE